MRFINTHTLELIEFFDSQVPAYAILSHVWGNEEISFAEMLDHNETTKLKAGYRKITKFCALTKRHGFEYSWVDTCCIDKRNSAELSEAINSMYSYYYDAAECFIFLDDVWPLSEGAIDHEVQIGFMKASRWFTRGWTTQELLAPKTRKFFARDWTLIDQWENLVGVVANITNIDEKALRDRDTISSFCVAQRMCWASKRQTTRSEDMAYSLMGIFNVNMPVIYGEGASKAFKRLQNEIMQTSFDQSIFAWRGDYQSSGFLARSPADFRDSPELGIWHPSNLSPYVMTNVGLSLRLTRIQKKKDIGERAFLAALQCDIKDNETWKILMIYLEPVGDGDANFFVNGKSCKAYRRVRCHEWKPIYGKELKGWPYENVLVLEDEHFKLFQRSIEDNKKRWE